MTEKLMKALTDVEPWLQGFDRNHYEETFLAYQTRFAPDYREAVQAAGEAGLEALADQLLDAMEAQWKRLHIWNRSAARMDTRQVIVGYLTPMLMEETALRPFAAALRDRWKSRWAKEAYHAAGYERIRSGFKLKILGFEIPEKKDPLPEDEI